MSESNTTTLLATIAGAILGGVTAIAGTLVLQLRAESHSRKDLMFRCWDDLISEIKQNSQHQVVSRFITLEEQAFKQFRENGFLATLEENLQNELRHLYSIVHQKNELIDLMRQGIPYGKYFGIYEADYGSTSSEMYVDSLTTLRKKIDDLTNKMLPDFEKEHVKITDS